MINKSIYKDMKWIKLDKNNIQLYYFTIAMCLLNSLTKGNVFAS